VTSVLIVEDEESLADPLAFLLRKEGFEATVVTDGPSALAEFDRAGADIVLLDLMLPGMSGTDVCKQLRSRSSVPVIMVTARDSEIDKVVGLELGADDYVTKPIDFDRLSAILQARLAGIARTQPSASRAVLNDRQIQVLTLVALGNTSVQIGHKLHLSKRTVDFHINNARIKLRATTRAEAAIKAVAAGLIKPEDDR